MSREVKNRRKARRRKKRILLIFEMVVLLFLLAAVFVVAKLNRLKSEDFNEKNLKMNDLEASNLKGYTNIALFGLDSRDASSLGTGNHSDTIMIASINNETKEINLVSVFRDTYLNLTTDDYGKATTAYFLGGPEQATSMLNMNLDLDIKDYVAVNFKALVNTIDLLDGLDIEITEEERVSLNDYAIETSKITGIDTEKVEDIGLVHMDGVQAASYARIRYIDNDYKRTERQRLVLSEMFEKAKKTDLVTLNKIVDNVIDEVSTNLSTTEIIKLGSALLQYNIGETVGFPIDKTTDGVEGSGDCVIPIDLEENVIQLHELLFEDESYSPSNTVNGISKKIMKTTGVKGESKE